jgi:SAM-dependent methyltransferase
MPADPGYDAAFYRHVNATATAAAAVVVPLLLAPLRPSSVLDVGCGQGAWLAVWRRAGVVDLAGVDGAHVDRTTLLFPEPCFRAHDLAQPFDLGRRFDLVQCLEVAEHLPDAAAPGLLDSLTRHGELVLFSAAPPGQGGHGHVNERRYDDWRARFATRGYVALDYLRPRIRHETRVAPWYRYNPLLYVERAALPRLAAAVRASLLPADAGIPDVAPLGYRIRRQLVRRLPVPLMTAIARVKERVGERGARDSSP